MTSISQSFSSGHLSGVGIREAICSASLAISRLLVFWRLTMFFSGETEDRYSGDPDVSRRYWFPLTMLSLPLIPVVMRALGLLTKARSWVWETHALLLGQAAVSSYVIGCGVPIVGDLEAFKLMYQMHSGLHVLMGLSRSFLEMSGVVTVIPLHFRLVPGLVMHSAAYYRMALTEVPGHGISFHFHPRVLALMALTMTADVILHLVTLSISSMIKDAEDAKSVIQQQRDVYMGLIEKATGGCCTFQTIGVDAPRLVDMSQKLQGLLGVDTQSVALPSIMGSTADVEHLLGIADEDTLPTIITCKTPDLMEFEVRVVPFRPPGGELKLCFFLASEKRPFGSDIRRPTTGSSTDNNEERQGSHALYQSEDVAPSLTSLAISKSTLHVEKHSVATQTNSEALPPTPHRASVAASRRQAYRAPVILKTRKVVLHQFSATTNATVRWFVWDVLRRCNPRGKGCCAWHIGLQTLNQQTLEMQALECSRGFRPYSGWQCRSCFALQEDSKPDEHSKCTVCKALYTQDSAPMVPPPRRMSSASSSFTSDVKSSSHTDTE